MTRASPGSKTGSGCCFLDEAFEWVDHLQALSNDSRIHGVEMAASDGGAWIPETLDGKAFTLPLTGNVLKTNLTNSIELGSCLVTGPTMINFSVYSNFLYIKPSGSVGLY